MRSYTRKPEQIVAFKLDFSTPQALWDTYNNLDRMDYEICHSCGQKYPAVSVGNEGKWFSQGDYICCDIKNSQWYGLTARELEETWQ